MSIARDNKMVHILIKHDPDDPKHQISCFKRKKDTTWRCSVCVPVTGFCNQHTNMDGRKCFEVWHDEVFGDEPFHSYHNPNGVDDDDDTDEDMSDDNESNDDEMSFDESV